MNVIAAVFLILHGLVHLLYTGQALKTFELQPGMTWPVGARVFSRLRDERITRRITAAACVLAAAIFLAGAAGILASQAWFRPVTVIASVFSAAVFLLFWDGKSKGITNSGLFAVLINAAVLVLLVLGKPDFGF